MIWLLGVATAFEPVVEKLAGGQVDWTALELEAGASGKPSGGMAVDYSTLEGDARSHLGPTVLELARRIQFTPSRTTGDLLAEENAVADRLDDNLGAWEVTEARYYASGKVELDGALALQYFLRPALVAGARGQEREGPPTLATTGLVVDARGLEVRYAVAPVLRAAEGGPVIYELATLTSYAASQRTPCVYVTDPADPAAVRRAGESPLQVRATAVQDGELLLDFAAARAVAEAATGAPFLLHGNVVIVTGPAVGP